MFFVTRVFFNAETGAQSNSIQSFTDSEQAYKRYYSILAADIDNNAYLYEMVQIVRDDGITLSSQVFDRRDQQAGEE